METTVTGMFKTSQLAALAAARLASAGFRPDQVRVVHARTPGRHTLIARLTADTRRAVILGVAFGGIGGALAGAALSGVFGLLQATLVGGLAVAAGGAVLGLCVGRATTTQVRDELEGQVDAGMVLVTVTTDSVGGPSALQLLAPAGDANLVATAASFQAGS